ncbi:MAG: hypothetical protein AAGE43_15510 [Pseudomonadota bacterium]
MFSAFDLERSVRLGRFPDDPGLLSAYISLCEEVDNWRIYLRAYHVLLAVICDDQVPRHWRCLTLDNVYRIITSMHELARTERERRIVRRCTHELSVLSHQHLSPN